MGSPSDFTLAGTPVPTGADSTRPVTYGTIPFGYAEFLKGGAHTPSNAADRNAIPTNLRVAGMPVFQEDEVGYVRYLKAAPWSGTDADWSDAIPLNQLALATIAWLVTGYTFGIKSIQGRITTASAASTAVAFYTVTNNTCVKLTAIVNGFCGTTGESYSNEITATYQRTGGGAPTLVGSLHPGFEDMGGTWGALTLGVTGNDVNVLVDGDPANNVNWACELRVQEVG